MGLKEHPDQNQGDQTRCLNGFDANIRAGLERGVDPALLSAYNLMRRGLEQVDPKLTLGVAKVIKLRYK